MGVCVCRGLEWGGEGGYNTGLCECVHVLVGGVGVRI